MSESTRIQELLVKISSLEKEVEDLEHEITEYKSQIECLDSENSKLMEELMDARDEINFLEAGAVQ